MLELMMSLAALAFAVSLDGFAVGVAYGLRKIKIPFFSIVIIACCSGLIIWLSMQAGTILTLVLSPQIAKWIGAFILIAMGSWSLLQHIRHRMVSAAKEKQVPVGKVQAEAIDQQVKSANSKQVLTLEMKRLGLVIQILRTPQAADVDRSGNISAKEAIMLGTALSLDALGAGIGAAMLGLPSLVTAFTIAICSALLLFGGLQAGLHMVGRRQLKWIAILPGILLVVIGIVRLL
ncbi:MntP/YtaF family protein [Paenibacillus yanchengensis]|uniref:MntP/YtaF family protein n=1 Tax=Paenibacillus yanchengensis TaxID=2035833 RepID=A0ABW4YQP4_9BACL